MQLGPPKTLAFSPIWDLNQLGKVKAYPQRALQLDFFKIPAFAKIKSKPSPRRESKNTLYHTKSHPLIPYIINPIPLALNKDSCDLFGNKGCKGKVSNIYQGLGLARFKIEHLPK